MATLPAEYWYVHTSWLVLPWLRQHVGLHAPQRLHRLPRTVSVVVRPRCGSKGRGRPDRAPLRLARGRYVPFTCTYSVYCVTTLRLKKSTQCVLKETRQAVEEERMQYTLYRCTYMCTMLPW
jgi:hypothetical protein